jgi:hypothetical protein
MLFTFVTKQVTLLRRSTVLSLLLLLVFPDQNHAKGWRRVGWLPNIGFKMKFWNLAKPYYIVTILNFNITSRATIFLSAKMEGC